MLSSTDVSNPISILKSYCKIMMTICSLNQPIETTPDNRSPSPSLFLTNNFFRFQNYSLRFYVFLNRWKTHILLKTALPGCPWVTCGQSWNISENYRQTGHTYPARFQPVRNVCKCICRLLSGFDRKLLCYLALALMSVGHRISCYFWAILPIIGLFWSGMSRCAISRQKHLK